MALRLMLTAEGCMYYGISREVNEKAGNGEDQDKYEKPQSSARTAQL